MSAPTPVDHDPVNHPKHYTSHPSGVECIEIIRHMPNNLGQVIKYIWRAGLKDQNPTLQDLEKAKWYLEDQIALVRSQQQHDALASVEGRVGPHSG